ncbi:MAG TPA: ATP-binding protein [Streptosporangiaceae bacterium]|nr:ATP-binding protein [Streptosporangiaceae bacterium]
MDAVEIQIGLHLPRDAASVPVSRQVLDACLQRLGVTPDTRADIALALGEACANVILHAGPGHEYQVLVRTRNGQCAIEVIDSGLGDDGETGKEGTDGFAFNGDLVAATAENGRGLKIIDAVVDNLQLTGSKRLGTTLSFEKTLTWLPGAPGQRLFDADDDS